MAKSFVAFSLVLIFGLVFGRNVVVNESKGGQPSTIDSSLDDEQDGEDSWNPLAELLGFKVLNRPQDERDTLVNLFEKHNQKMDSAIAKHQRIMDDAMKDHQTFLANAFGDSKTNVAQHNAAMDEHQNLMDSVVEQHKKDMIGMDFSNDWEQFDKDMGDMFKEFDRHLELMSNPFEQQREDSMIESIKDEKGAEQVGPTQNKTGFLIRTNLPVFRISKIRSAQDNEPDEESSDDKLPALINHIVEGFQPMLESLQKEVQDRINVTTELADKAEPLNTNLTVQNSTISDDNSTAIGGMFSRFMGSMVGSLAHLGTLLIDHLVADENQTELIPDVSGDAIRAHDCSNNDKTMEAEPIARDNIGLERKLKIAYVLHALENVLMGRITKLTFEDYDQDLQNLHKEGFAEDDLSGAAKTILQQLKDNGKKQPIGIIWSKLPWEVADIHSEFDSTSEMLDEVVPVVSGRLLSYIEEKDHKLADLRKRLDAQGYIEKQIRREYVIKDDDDYEWYEWVTVGLIAGTSTLLLIVALFMCVQKSRRSRSVKLAVKEEDGMQAQNSVSNENLSNKCKEKIKTIFVNLK